MLCYYFDLLFFIQRVYNMSICFDFLPVKGEAILVTVTDDNFTMLIDCGSSHIFKQTLFKKSKYYKEHKTIRPKVDVCIVTHIDQDHIGGAITLFNDKNFLQNIKQIWFNEPESAVLFSEPNNQVSTGQGVKLKDRIDKNSDIKHVPNISTLDFNEKVFTEILKPITSSITIDLLSPNKKGLDELYKFWNNEEYKKSLGNQSSQVSSEIVTKKVVDCQTVMNEMCKKKRKDFDSSKPNKSSIAFILNYKKFSFLLLADAHIDVICESLTDMGYSKENPLFVEFVKLSHHGSKRNINIDFFNLVHTKNYIICRNEMKKLPNIETIYAICCARRNKSDLVNIIINKKFNSAINSIDEKFLEGSNVKIIEKTQLKYGE